MRLHCADGHKYRKYEISGERKAELLAVYAGCQLRAEYAKLDQPAGTHGKPEKGVCAKCGHTECVIMFGILNAGEQLGKRSEENRPRNGVAQTFRDPQLLGRSDQRYDRQSEQADSARIGRHDFYVCR